MIRAYVSKRHLECNISGEATDVITEIIAFNHAFYSQTLKTGDIRGICRNVTRLDYRIS